MASPSTATTATSSAEVATKALRIYARVRERFTSAGRGIAGPRDYDSWRTRGYAVEDSAIVVQAIAYTESS